MVGGQGSGKSTLSKYLNKKYHFGIINRDSLKTVSKMIKEFQNI
jgi:dephospho-CoA kinase